LVGKPCAPSIHKIEAPKRKEGIRAASTHQKKKKKKKKKKTKKTKTKTTTKTTGNLELAES
jgi:hypothetical protein